MGRGPATSAFLAGESRDRSRSASPWLATAAVPLPCLTRSSTSLLSPPDWLAVHCGSVLSSGGASPHQAFRCRVACGPGPVVVVVVAFASSVARVFITLVVVAIAVVVVVITIFDVGVIAVADVVVLTVADTVIIAVADVIVAPERCRCCYCCRTRALSLLLLLLPRALPLLVAVRGRCRCCCCWLPRALPLLLSWLHAGAAAACRCANAIAGEAPHGARVSGACWLVRARTRYLLGDLK